MPPRRAGTQELGFRRFLGSRYSARNLDGIIALGGDETGRVVGAGEAYTSVVFEGVIPGGIDPSVHDCRHVHLLVPGRGWVLEGEYPGLSTRVIGGRPIHREREGARWVGARFPG